jgi:hypothetical protein
VNPKSTGILFLAAAALAAFVYFYEIRGEEGRREAEEAGKRIFAGFEAEAVEAIALTATDGVAVRAERQDGQWQIVEPLAFPADVYAFEAMASALAQMLGESAIEDAQEPSVYGLDSAAGEVRFDAGGAEHVLRVGSKTPVGSNSYVSSAGGEAIYIVPSASVNSFAKTFDDLREKRLLDFDRDAVQRIEVSWREGGAVLERIDGSWRVVEPVAGPADEEVVAGLLSDLSFLRASGFADDPPPDDQTGLDRPSFAVRLSGDAPDASAESAAAGEPFEVALAIGSLPAGDAVLARAAQPSLYRIAEERLEDFPVELVAYRFKQLAKFAALDAQRLEILFHSAAGESVAISAERGDDGWTSQPASFRPGKLAALIGALANLAAVDIAAESMGEAELAGTGLAPAQASFRVLGAAGEGETDAPVLAEVQLGATTGSGVAAQRAGDDTVYVIDNEIGEHLPVGHEAFENRFRAPDEPAPAPVLEAPAPTAADEP